THRQEKSGTAGYPTAAVQRKSTAWHDTVQMWMSGESLSPAVQDTEEADLCAQVFRIGCDGLESFSRSPEQQTVHLSLVLEGECHEWFGQSEDNMKIFARQKLSLT